MIVVIEPIDKTGPRGDRDRNRHPYKDYRVHVLNSLSDPPSDASVVHEVGGFNSWHCTIEPLEETKQEALTFARKLADRMAAKVFWSHDLPKTPVQEFKTIRAVVECKVPQHITEKSLVQALDRILQHPIQLGFSGNKETLVKPKFKSFSRVLAAEKRSES